MKKFLALILSLCMMLSICAMAAAEDVPTLKWVTVGNGMPDNYDAWLAKLNPYLEEKIGAHIEMEVVGWGDWDNRRNIIINTVEPYDIIFGNQGTLNEDASIGAYLDISELVTTAAPELVSYIPADYWDACKVSGKLYAVPTYKDSSITECVIWDKAVVEQNGLADAVAQVKTLSDMTPILTELKDKVTEVVFPMHSVGATYLLYNYDNMSTGLAALGVRFDDSEMKVVPVLEQADVMADLKILHDWYNNGLINADAATKPEENSYKLCSFAQGWPYAAVTTWGPNMGVDVVAYTYGDTILSNDSVLGSINSISANCKYPEKALAFLQLINTDSLVRDAFYYGLEGDNFTYTDNGKVHKNPDRNWSMAGYTQGTFFNVTPTDDTDYNQWDEVKALNEAAKPSVLLGFVFNTENVADQLASCKEIFSRYRGELLTGTIEPEEGVAAMMQEMRDAGFEDIVAEAQAQIDAWKAAK